MALTLIVKDWTTRSYMIKVKCTCGIVNLCSPPWAVQCGGCGLDLPKRYQLLPKHIGSRMRYHYSWNSA